MKVAGWIMAVLGAGLLAPDFPSDIWTSAFFLMLFKFFLGMVLVLVGSDLIGSLRGEKNERRSKDN